VFHWVLVHVIQAREIGFLECQSRVPEIMPDLTTRGTVKLVSPFCGFLMQTAEHVGKTLRAIFQFRRVGHKVIVVRKNRPSFQIPTKLASDCE